MAQDLNALQANLQQQVGYGWISQGQADAEMRRVMLLNAQENLQQQVTNGWINQAQADQELARLNSISYPELAAASGIGTVAAPPDPYDASIAKPGSRTSGTTIGNVREINPASIALTPGMAATQIDPVAIANNIAIGSAQQMGTPERVTGNSAGHGQQLALLTALRAQSEGQGPSLAKLQLQEGMERNLANQMGAIAAQRGVNAGLAMRLYGQQAGAASQQTAMDAAQARIQEQLNAQQQLAALSGQVREQDIGIQTFNAQTAYQKALANMQARNDIQSQQAGLNAQIALANQLAKNTQNYNQAQITQNTNQYNSEQAYQRAVAQANLNQNAALANQAGFNQTNIAQGNVSGGIAQSSIAADAAKYAADKGLEGDIIGAAANNQDYANPPDNQNFTGNTGVPPTNPGNPPGTVSQPPFGSHTSDERAKKNIKSGDAAIEDMLSKLAASLYEYKNGNKHGKGQQLGIMAQDLEKSGLGKHMVKSTNEGKQVDFVRGLATMLAGQANLHKRMAKLEGK